MIMIKNTHFEHKFNFGYLKYIFLLILNVSLICKMQLHIFTLFVKN